MNQLLKDIVAAKRSDMKKILSAAPKLAREIEPRPFREALVKGDSPSIIAEIKKGSPSRGIICEDFSASQIASEYASGGATALSVLTDERFFYGAPENLRLAKESSKLPALCKDFFIDPAQMQWAKLIGADAALLIVRILSQGQLLELMEAGAEAGLDLLIEIHEEEEIERALNAGANMIGINNRNLDTFEVDINLSLRLIERIPASHALAIAESGISTHEDIRNLSRAGFGAFLVGESLMSADDRVSKLKRLRGVEK